jgi:tape measure domain-containing protein
MATSNGNRDVTLAVGIKTSGEEALRNLAAEVQTLAKRGGDAAPAYQNLANELQRLSQAAGQLDAFKALSADVDRLAAEQQQAATAARELAAALEQQRSKVAEAAEQERRAQLELKQTRAALNEKRDALEQLNIDTDRAARSELDYLSKSRQLKQEILDQKQALRDRREALTQASAAVDKAEAAETKLAAQYERTSKAATQIDTALNAQREAMTRTVAIAEQLGVSITDVAAAEEKLLATQQKLVGGVAEARIAAAREQAQADRLAITEAQALAELYERGRVALAAETAAINEAAAASRRYAQAKADAANEAARVAAEERRAAEAFNAAAAAATRANEAALQSSKNADYVKFWTAEVDRLAAAERRAADEAQRLANEERRAQEAFEAAAVAATRANEAALQASKNADYLKFWTAELDKIVAAEQRAAQEALDLANAGKRAAEELQQAFGTTGVRSLQAVQAEVTKVGAALNTLQANYRSGAISAEDLARATSSAQVRLAQLRQEAATIPALPNAFERMNSSINDLIGKFGSLTAAIATVGIAVKPVVDATIELERMTRVLTTVTGSSAEAGRQIEFLRNVSQRAGQSFSATGDAYAKFAAAALGSGVSLQTVQKTFESVSLAAGNLGLTSDQTSRILNALGQSASKGVIQMEELRGQLGDALPGAMSLLAKGLGLTDTQLNKLVESGNLLARDAMPALAEALVQLAPKEGQGVSGLVAEFNRLKNIVVETSTILSSGAFGSAIGAVLSGLGAAVERVSFGVALIGESFTVVGRQIGATVAAIVTGDFKNLGDALAAIEAESTQKLAGLAARIEGTGTAATAAAAGANTLSAAMRDATLQVGRVAEQQTAAAQATGAASAAASTAAASWVQLSIALAENVSIAEKAAVVADTVAKAKKIEADAAAAIIQISGNEVAIRNANAQAAAGEAQALRTKAAADALVAQRLREGLEALEARARAEGRADEATKKALDTLKQKLAAAEADAEKTRQQADAARVHAAALDIQARSLQDNSGKVQLYRDELDKATSALSSAITLWGRDKATKEDVQRATEAVARAEASLRDAISDRARSTERAIESMKLDHQIKRAGIQLQIEESRAAQILAQARGDEAAAAREAIKQKQLQIALAKDSVQATIEEAQARKQAAQQELADTVDLLPEKREELELRIKNADAAIAEAKARQAGVKVIEAERTALEGRNRAAAASPSAGGGGGATGLGGLRSPGSFGSSGTSSTAGNIDGSGMGSFGNSVGKTDTMMSAVDASYVFDLWARFQQGRVSPEELPVIRNALAVAEANARLGGPGSVSAEGRRDDQMWIGRLKQIIDAIAGPIESPLAPRKTSTGAGDSGGTAQAPSRTTSAPSATASGGSLQPVVINLPGFSSTRVNVANASEAAALRGLLAELANSSGRAA